MTGISVKKAAEIVGGEIYGEGDTDLDITSVVIDSRKVIKDSMFVALPGTRVDGHDYINSAFSLGAACCIAERRTDSPLGAVILVPNVRKAIIKLAEYYRNRFNIPVIGIAGSVGKTTAKEMVASVLSERFKVLKTEKNLNNELGVQLTVFRLEPEHELAVVEMGISDFGEMTQLAEIVRPTMALYTLIGHAHLEHLHDREGILKAKTELIPYLPSDGAVFLNADDDLLTAYTCPQERILFGTGENADVRAENIRNEGLSSLRCDIVCGERRISVLVPAYGRHMVYAALEGAAVGIKFGLSDEEIINGIAKYETVGRRANISDTGFVTLIDDCYNANPDSVKCGIDSLKSLSGRKVCILGDMLEMGEEKEQIHYEIGKYAQESGVELLLTVGKLSENTARGAEKIASIHFDTNAKLIEKLSELLKRGDTVLVKASNYMRFDEISEAIKNLKRST